MVSLPIKAKVTPVDWNRETHDSVMRLVFNARAQAQQSIFELKLQAFLLKIYKILKLLNLKLSDSLIRLLKLN